MKENFKILICYNSPVSIFSVYNGKPNDNQTDINDLSESAFSKEISSLKKTMQEYFSDVKTLAIDRNVNRTVTKINSYAPDVILNFVESVEGISTYEYCMAGLFELLKVEFTGNQPLCLGNCLNKWRAKDILRANNINTPNALVINNSTDLSKKTFSLRFPVILKLLTEDASIGISEYSVVNDFIELNRQIEFLSATYNQSVIAEEYIDGRELNVAVLGGRTLPISEIEFKGLPEGLPKIVTYDGKWIEGSIYYQNTKPKCPAELETKIKQRIESTALQAYDALGCRDYARVDIRLDKNGIPFVIEVNPNPDISSDSGFARAAAADGMSHSELLLRIIKFALDRKINDTQVKAS
ncbi:MAG: ATP-grasp domain-containing protein [Ignavibacteriaceae bacterium]|nr:ATP-grasp domain-containing protein [Ignavibacteriaceae bacterium]